MDDSIAKMVANKKLATFRINEWIGLYTKGEIAKMLQMSRPTLETRLKLDNWRFKEIELITKNLPF